MPEPDLSEAVIREDAVLQKFEGDVLVETVRMVDGVIVETIKHQED